MREVNVSTVQATPLPYLCGQMGSQNGFTTASASFTHSGPRIQFRAQIVKSARRPAALRDMLFLRQQNQWHYLPSISLPLHLDVFNQQLTFSILTTQSLYTLFFFMNTSITISSPHTHTVLGFIHS